MIFKIQKFINKFDEILIKKRIPPAVFYLAVVFILFFFLTSISLSAKLASRQLRLAQMFPQDPYQSQEPGASISSSSGPQASDTAGLAVCPNDICAVAIAGVGISDCMGDGVASVLLQEGEKQKSLVQRFLTWIKSLVGIKPKVGEIFLGERRFRTCSEARRAQNAISACYKRYLDDNGWKPPDPNNPFWPFDSESTWANAFAQAHDGRRPDTQDYMDFHSSQLFVIENKGTPPNDNDWKQRWESKGWKWEKTLNSNPFIGFGESPYPNIVCPPNLIPDWDVDNIQMICVSPATIPGYIPPPSPSPSPPPPSPSPSPLPSPSPSPLPSPSPSPLPSPSPIASFTPEQTSACLCSDDGIWGGQRCPTYVRGAKCTLPSDANVGLGGSGDGVLEPEQLEHCTCLNGYYSGFNCIFENDPCFEISPKASVELEAVGPSLADKQGKQISDCMANAGINIFAYFTCGIQANIAEKPLPAVAYLSTTSENERHNLIKNAYEGDPLGGFFGGADQLFSGLDDFFNTNVEGGHFVPVVGGVVQTVSQLLNPRKWIMSEEIADTLKDEANKGNMTGAEAFELAKNDAWVSRSLVLKATDDWVNKSIDDNSGDWGAMAGAWAAQAFVKVATAFSAVGSFGSSNTTYDYMSGSMKVNQEVEALNVKKQTSEYQAQSNEAKKEYTDCMGGLSESASLSEINNCQDKLPKDYYYSEFAERAKVGAPLALETAGTLVGGLGVGPGIINRGLGRELSAGLSKIPGGQGLQAVSKAMDEGFGTVVNKLFGRGASQTAGQAVTPPAPGGVIHNVVPEAEVARLEELLKQNNTNDAYDLLDRINDNLDPVQRARIQKAVDTLPVEGPAGGGLADAGVSRTDQVPVPPAGGAAQVPAAGQVAQAPAPTVPQVKPESLQDRVQNWWDDLRGKPKSKEPAVEPPTVPKIAEPPPAPPAVPEPPVAAVPAPPVPAPKPKSFREDPVGWLRRQFGGEPKAPAVEPPAAVAPPKVEPPVAPAPGGVAQAPAPAPPAVAPKPPAQAPVPVAKPPAPAVLTQAQQVEADLLARINKDPAIYNKPIIIEGTPTQSLGTLRLQIEQDVVRQMPPNTPAGTIKEIVDKAYERNLALLAEQERLAKVAQGGGGVRPAPAAQVQPLRTLGDCIQHPIRCIKDGFGPDSQIGGTVQAPPTPARAVAPQAQGPSWGQQIKDWWAKWNDARLLAQARNTTIREITAESRTLIMQGNIPGDEKFLAILKEKLGYNKVPADQIDGIAQDLNKQYKEIYDKELAVQQKAAQKPQAQKPIPVPPEQINYSSAQLGQNPGVVPLSNKLVIGTDIGLARPANEDAVWGGFLPGNRKALVLGDGMGGYAAGEVASNMAVNKTSKALLSLPDGASIEEIRASMVKGIQDVNNEVYIEAQRLGNNMGTTIVSVVKGTDDKAVIAHVGDSRASTFRVKRGSWTRETWDHSWVEEQVQAKVLTPEQARVHPQRNVITRAVGNKPDVVVDTAIIESLEPGDIIMLYSDGMNELTDGEINQIIKNGVRQKKSLDNITQDLITAANQRGGRDNISVALMQW